MFTPHRDPLQNLRFLFVRNSKFEVQGLPLAVAKRRTHNQMSLWLQQNFARNSEGDDFRNRLVLELTGMGCQGFVSGTIIGGSSPRGFRSSYGIKVGVRMPQKSEFVCHESRFVHHILCESPFMSRDFYAIRLLMSWHILGGIFLLISCIWGVGA